MPPGTTTAAVSRYMSSSPQQVSAQCAGVRHGPMCVVHRESSLQTHTTAHASIILGSYCCPNSFRSLETQAVKTDTRQDLRSGYAGLLSIESSMASSISLLLAPADISSTQKRLQCNKAAADSYIDCECSCCQWLQEVFCDRVPAELKRLASMHFPGIADGATGHFANALTCSFTFTVQHCGIP